MHFAFGRVRRRIARRAHPFVVGQFIARLLPKYFLKLHEPRYCALYYQIEIHT